MKVSMSHWDLDGVCSYIVMDSIVHFDKSLKGGYHREEEMVRKIKHGDNVVTDFVLSPEFYKELKTKAGSVIVIDHHSQTLTLKEEFPTDAIHYDGSKSATKLVRDLAVERGYSFTKQMDDLVQYANAYDLYKRTEEPENFSVGYDLNLLFWKYSFDDFACRFDHGFDGFTEEELIFLEKKKMEHATMINSSYYSPYLGENINSLICLCKEPSIINDIPYHKTGYDAYFIVTRYKNTLSVSLRAGESNTVLNGYCSEITKEAGVISSGGHEQACGITLDPSLNDKDVLNIVVKYHNYLDNGLKMD